MSWSKNYWHNWLIPYLKLEHTEKATSSEVADAKLISLGLGRWC